MQKYFRLQIYSQNGKIYQKDFNVLILFDRPIHLYVSELVERNILQNSEKFMARIIPSANNLAPKYNTESIQEDQKLIITQNENGWLTVVYPEGHDPLQPMSYFTLEICTVMRPNGRNLVYRRDLPLSELNHFWRRIDTALCNRGLIRSDEPIEHFLFARNDGEANFEKEIISTPPSEMDDLKIELRPSVSPPRKKKRFSEDKIRIIGKPTEKDLKIILTQHCYDGLEKLAINQENPHIEIGGVLLGEVFDEEITSETIIEIHEFIPAESTQASIASLRFTHETWSLIDQHRKNEFPDKITVGWYHTHPFKIEGREGLAIFFSSMDAFIHKTFFREPWHVAMVLGFHGQAKGFFQWREKNIMPCGGFYIYQ